MSEFWWILALCASLVSGAMIYTNQIFKMPSSLLMVYRGVVQSLILLPFFPLFEMPDNPLFWFFGILQGTMIAFSDKRTFLCSRLFGGEIVSSMKPYEIAFIFVLWLIIRPSQFFELLQTPDKFAVILLCLGLVVYSVRQICKKSLSREAFLMLLPALGLAVCINVNNKYTTALGAEVGLPSAIFYYCWITALFSGIPNLYKYLQHRDWRLIFAPRYMIGGFLVIFFILCGNAFKNTAMYYTSNPAYVTAVMSLYPVWIILWNNFYYRWKDAEKFPRCNFLAVGLLLIAVISLILVQ